MCKCAKAVRHQVNPNFCIVTAAVQSTSQLHCRAPKHCGLPASPLTYLLPQVNGKGAPALAPQTAEKAEAATAEQTALLMRQRRSVFPKDLTGEEVPR